MPGTLTLSKELLAKRNDAVAERPPERHTKKAPGSGPVPYNLVLVCGNMTEVFTPERFDEVPAEIARWVQWGNDPKEIRLGLLDGEDPFG